MVVLGSGATACAALAGVFAVGGESVTLVVRDVARAAGTLAVARAHGFHRRPVTWDDLGVGDLVTAKSLINTTPADALGPALAERLVAALPPWSVVLDAVYHPWPTPLAEAAAARGLPVATGLDMLLHQAFGQVEQFTGLPAPREAMHEALAATTDVDPPAPAGVSARGCQPGGHAHVRRQKSPHLGGPPASDLLRARRFENRSVPRAAGGARPCSLLRPPSPSSGRVHRPRHGA